ncbi:solute carrier family 28 member 3-like isoform X1 [Takifugu flavidus]|uniref:solute carrier family 28 member 3-like isoform X1 n=1 Tax=Takifugu flavidus TaxID=433684 RepID=UPI0025446650|nr:solute carrier family 28 member 3-like isoform X1 [Takifugu flavidus]
MELIEQEELRQRHGKVNEAFISDEQMQMNNDGVCGKETGEENSKAGHHDKSILEKKMTAFQDYLHQHSDQIILVAKIVLVTAFLVMVIIACVLNLQRALGLLILTLLAVFFYVWDWLMKRYGSWMWEASSSIRCLLSRSWVWMRWVALVSLLVFVVLWLALDTAQRGPRQMVSFLGLLLLIFLMLLFSKHPFKWSWRVLVSGILIQFIIALLIFRTSTGDSALKWAANKVEILFAFEDVGSRFVFGEKFTDHPFVFKVMPVLLFLSSIISVLYYIGFMPWLICKIGYAMQVTMGTTPVESVVAAGTIFLGQAESLILVHPYISRLTLSEIHTLMTVGLAGISGTMLAAYISLGVKATYVLTATVMTAPASLAVGKIFWPETETSQVKDEEDIKTNIETNTTVIEAASTGATSAVGLAVTIVVNLMVFISLISFLDGVLSWFGGLFDFPQLSFSLIFSYLFMPLAFMMGVSYEDSFIVAELIGIKTVLNELLAYQKMSKIIKLRNAGGPEYVDNVKQYISVHSEMIATYALCGFSNFASMGIAFGCMTNLAPGRQADIARCGIRALVAGSVSCFMTACIAGILYIPEVPEVLCAGFLSTHFNKSVVMNSSQLVACCTHLYTSVTVHEPWNITISEGFNESSLRQCCLLTPSAQFNCSLLL